MSKNYGAKQVLHDCVDDGRMQYSDDVQGELEFLSDLADILSVQLECLKDRVSEGRVRHDGTYPAGWHKRG